MSMAIVVSSVSPVNIEPIGTAKGNVVSICLLAIHFFCVFTRSALSSLPRRTNILVVLLKRTFLAAESTGSLPRGAAKIPGKCGDFGAGTNYFCDINDLMAERQGFEPWIQFPVYTLSKRAPSATRPSLRWRNVLKQRRKRGVFPL
jgi:hypothetical protein